VKLQRFEALECNPKPGQRDYPECWTYTVEPVADQRDACLPARVKVTHSGWQAILDDLVARVEYDGTPPRTAKLVLEKVEGSIMGFSGKPGSVLATLAFGEGRVTELRFGPGMPSHIKTKALPIKKEP
jgi:hypothetical protein